MQMRSHKRDAALHNSAALHVPGSEGLGVALKRMSSVGRPWPARRSISRSLARTRALETPTWTTRSTFLARPLWPRSPPRSTPQIDPRSTASPPQSLPQRLPQVDPNGTPSRPN